MGSRDRLLRRTFIAVAVVACAVMVIAVALDRSRESEPLPPAEDFARHVKGPENAPVALIVYNDFECSYCKVFHLRLLPVIERAYGDRISIEYRHFPLPRHPKALVEAEASECVARQLGEAGFWKFVDAMFVATPSDNGFELSRLPGVAVSVGADHDAYMQCMADEGGRETVLSHINAGVADDIDVTPTIVIRGAGEEVRIERAYPGLVTNGIEYVFARVAAQGSVEEAKGGL